MGRSSRSTVVGTLGPRIVIAWAAVGTSPPKLVTLGGGPGRTGHFLADLTPGWVPMKFSRKGMTQVRCHGDMRELGPCSREVTRSSEGSEHAGRRRISNG